MKRILKEVTYSLDVKDKAKYTYHFIDGLSIKRNYISPFTRLNSEIFALKLPFLRQCLFANELAIMPIIIILCIRNFYIIKDLILNFSPDKIGQPILFLLLCGFTIMIFTTRLSDLLTFFYGKPVQGIIRASEEYSSSDDGTSMRHTLELPDGNLVIIGHFPTNDKKVGERIDLKIHPDDIPYATRNDKTYIYTWTCLIVLFYLLLFSGFLFV